MLGAPCANPHRQLHDGVGSNDDVAAKSTVLSKIAAITSKWHCCGRVSLLNIPIQAGGIALNIVALAGLLAQLSESYPHFASILLPLSTGLRCESSVLQLVVLARALACKPGGWLGGVRVCHLGRELSSRRQVAGYGAFLVAVQLASAQWAVLGPIEYQVARIVGHAAAAANYVLTAHFLRLSYMRRAAPEPFWFPATVSLATICIMGPSVGTPTVLMDVGLVLGCLVALATYPPCLWNVVRYPQTVAPNPSIFVLMAPIPFVTTAMFHMRVSTHAPLLGNNGRAVCFILNTLNVIIAFGCAFQRRRALCSMLWPMSPAWAALTFPMVSNCAVSVFYASECACAHTCSTHAPRHTCSPPRTRPSPMLQHCPPVNFLHRAILRHPSPAFLEPEEPNARMACCMRTQMPSRGGRRGQRRVRYTGAACSSPSRYCSSRSPMCSGCCGCPTGSAFTRRHGPAR